MERDYGASADCCVMDLRQGRHRGLAWGQRRGGAPFPYPHGGFAFPSDTACMNNWCVHIHDYTTMLLPCFLAARLNNGRPLCLHTHTHWQRLCPRVIYSPSVTQTHWPWQISQFISWLERRYTWHEPRVILGAPFQARSGTRSSPDPLGLFRNNSPIVRESACTHVEFEAGCVSAESCTPPHGCLLIM